MENDKTDVDMCVGDVENGNQWRFRIRVPIRPTPNSWEKGKEEINNESTIAKKRIL
jgi:hypothetical protein